MDWLAPDERRRFRIGLLAADRVAEEELGCVDFLDAAAGDAELPAGEAPCARAEMVPAGGAAANARHTARRA